MTRKLMAVMCGICFAAYCSAAFAQELPKKGTFSVHSGWKAVGETTQVAEGRTYGYGTFWGVTFNDKGSGPLHMGPAVCSYTLEIMKGLTGQGQCTWSDVNGDKIFSDWTAVMPANSQFEGTFKLTGGTGKYAGIEGKASEQCKPLNANGQWACAEQFEYRLP